jgi:hypothetical protein
VTADDALDQLVGFLEDRPDFVDTATITKGAASVLWESTDGILMAAHAGVLRPEGQRGATSPVGADGALGAAAAATDKAAEGDNAIVLGPFAWQFEPLDETDAIAQLLTDAGFSVTLKRNELQADQNVSIDDFRNFDDQEAVAIASHGDGYADGRVIVLTADAADALELVANQDDLLAQRLVLCNGAFCVTSSFVREYNPKLDDCIVYIGSCRSTFSDDMANAFLDGGPPPSSALWTT